VGPAVAAVWCRAAHDRCPAYRFVRSAGRPLHPADFAAWVTLTVKHRPAIEGHETA
jgi:hypothetical protein